MRRFLPFFLIFLFTGCAASAQFHEMREFVDADGNKIQIMVETSRVNGKSWFGGFRAKKGDAELEYIPGIKAPDTIPIIN